MKIAIIGGGAAGFFLAVNLKTFAPQVEVTVFERQADVLNILVLQNAFEKTRKQMKVNALIINTLSDNLIFPMFAKLTLKKT